MDARKPYDRLPRVLVTGFSVFPGAPVNPTEALIGILEARRVELAGIADLHTETLAVEYLSVADRLDRWAVDIRPDIAIHFGLSARAHGFTLERIAKNVAGTDRPDNAGHTPADPLICAGPESFTSTLPLAGIRDALAARSLPVSMSEDCGDYLCNFLFYRSCAGLHPGFLDDAFGRSPELAGFIHVPPLAAENSGDPSALTLDQLAEGAMIIVRACCAAWASRNR